MVSNLLRDGMFATQGKIDAAPENEVRELAEKLWYLRQDFSDSAKKLNLMPIISQHFLGKGFPDDTKEIAELLKFPLHRQQILRELDAFVDEYKYRPDLLRFRKIHDPVELFRSIGRLSTVKEQYIAVNDNFDTLTAERTQDGYIVPLKNIMDAVYSKDISRKILPAISTKQQKGEFIGSWAAYGYQKCAGNAHRIEPDPETAPVVREIFSLRLTGMSYGGGADSPGTGMVHQSGWAVRLVEAGTGREYP